MVNSLEYAEYIPEEKVESLVIMLHGYGADKNDLIGLASHIGYGLPNTAFVSPDGFQPCEMGFGRQWFSIGNMDKDAMYDGLKVAHPIIDNFIDEQMERFNLSADKVVLLGFSQGTMLSLHTAPRRAQQLAGVLGFSGMLVGSDTLKDEIKTKPPVCLIHGDADEVVNVEFLKLASDCLVENGFEVENLICPNLAHGIDNDGLLTGIKFLQKQLGVANT
ncbi:MAG: alpha/beta hydrolase [Alphaproteobacteria bacterium]